MKNAQETMGFEDSMQKGGGYQSVDMGSPNPQRTANEFELANDAAANVMTKPNQSAPGGPYSSVG